MKQTRAPRGIGDYEGIIRLDCCGFWVVVNKRKSYYELSTIPTEYKHQKVCSHCGKTLSTNNNLLRLTYRAIPLGTLNTRNN